MKRGRCWLDSSSHCLLCAREMNEGEDLRHCLGTSCRPPASLDRFRAAVCDEKNDGGGDNSIQQWLKGKRATIARLDHLVTPIILPCLSMSFAQSHLLIGRHTVNILLPCLSIMLPQWIILDKHSLYSIMNGR
uniref:Uncharacterized protein n=1 Tax=Arundo donax TaxID=35708 RepID=A0A0A9DN19_ARUDO